MLFNNRLIKLDVSSVGDEENLCDVLEHLPLSQVGQLLLRKNDLSDLCALKRCFHSMTVNLTELSLQENCFSDFPMEILVLKNLVSLSLSKNSFDSIPEGTLSGLTNLRWLNLSQNKLSELPADLTKCMKLKGLDLHFNNFKELPAVVCLLTRVEILLVQQNHISCIPHALSGLKKLETLNLESNLLTEIPPVLVYNPPPNLTHLFFSSNNLRTINPCFLSIGYEELTSLDLHSCQLEHLEGALFQYLSKCKNFARLNLANNLLTSLPLEIGDLKQLQWLNLKSNQLEKLPPTLCHLSNLVRLGLAANKLQTLPHNLFFRMLNLKKLDLRDNQLKYLPFSLLMLAPKNGGDILDFFFKEHSINTLDHYASPNHASIQRGSLHTLLIQNNHEMENDTGILYTLNDGTTQVKLEFKSAVNTPPHIYFRYSTYTLMSNFVSVYKYISATPCLSTTKLHLPARDMMQFMKSATLKETSLRSMLNHWSKDDPSFHFDHQHEFLHKVTSSGSLPPLLQEAILNNTKLCDRCRSWYLESRFQVGYEAHFSASVKVTVRMNVCSTECAVQTLLLIRYLSVVDENPPGVRDWNDGETAYGRPSTKRSFSCLPTSGSINNCGDDIGPPAIHNLGSRYINGRLVEGYRTLVFSLGDPTPSLVGFRFLPARVIQLSNF